MPTIVVFGLPLITRGVYRTIRIRLHPRDKSLLRSRLDGPNRRPGQWKGEKTQIPNTKNALEKVRFGFRWLLRNRLRWIVAHITYPGYCDKYLTIFSDRNNEILLFKRFFNSSSTEYLNRATILQSAPLILLETTTKTTTPS